jgi:hypothetical protein
MEGLGRSQWGVEIQNGTVEGLRASGQMMRIRIRIRIKVRSRIRIRINVKRGIRIKVMRIATLIKGRKKLMIYEER